MTQAARSDAAEQPAPAGPFINPQPAAAVADNPPPPANGFRGLASEPAAEPVARPDTAQALQDMPGDAPVSVPELLAQGRASWYGQRFHGRRTASGEPFDMHALTAAHRTLPFGSRVRVRSVHTGKEVVVRINDRGPHQHQRIIDLSYAAAKALGVKERGVTEVLVLRE